MREESGNEKTIRILPAASLLLLFENRTNSLIVSHHYEFPYIFYCHLSPKLARTHIKLKTLQRFETADDDEKLREAGQSRPVIVITVTVINDAPSLLARGDCLRPGHLDACKDVCDSFGVNNVLMPCVDPSSNNKVIQGFTIKSYRNANNVAGRYSSDASEMKFADEEWDFSGIDEDEDGTASAEMIQIAAPKEDSVVINLSKN